MTFFLKGDTRWVNVVSLNATRCILNMLKQDTTTNQATYSEIERVLVFALAVGLKFRVGLS